MRIASSRMLLIAVSANLFGLISCIPRAPAIEEFDKLGARLTRREQASGAYRLAETGVRFGSAELREPVGLAVDAFGFVYVADAMAGKVFRYDSSGHSLEFSQPEGGSSFYPIDLCVQESFVFVLDYSGNRLLRYDTKGVYLDVMISFSKSSARPVSVTSGLGGRFITTDLTKDCIELWSPLLDKEIVIGGFGSAAGYFSDPRKAVILPERQILVVESGNKRIQLFSPSGRYERTIAEGGFISPRYVAVDPTGSVFVCDPEAGKISIFSNRMEPIGEIVSWEGEPIAPSCAAAGWDGKLYVADLIAHSIVIYLPIAQDIER